MHGCTVSQLPLKSVTGKEWDPDIWNEDICKDKPEL